MPIHNVIIVNADGDVLFRRYFDGCSIERQREWEQLLYVRTHNNWCNARNETHQVLYDEDKFVVYTGLFDLTMFFTGSDECDELLLSGVMDVFIEFVKENCVGKSKDITEANIIDQFEKVCLGLDEMISTHGILDILDTHSSTSMIGFKLPKSNRSIRSSTTSTLDCVEHASTSSSSQTQHQLIDEVRARFAEQYLANQLLASGATTQ